MHSTDPTQLASTTVLGHADYIPPSNVRLCCIADKEMTFFFLPNLRSNRQLEAPLPLTFSCTIFCRSALLESPISFAFIHFLAKQIWAPWYNPNFHALLRGGPRRRKLKMWFQALEFAVSCAAAKLICLLLYVRRAGAGTRTYDTRCQAFSVFYKHEKKKNIFGVS